MQSTSETRHSNVMQSLIHVVDVLCLSMFCNVRSDVEMGTYGLDHEWEYQKSNYSS